MEPALFIGQQLPCVLGVKNIKILIMKGPAVITRTIWANSYGNWTK